MYRQARKRLKACYETPPDIVLQDQNLVEMSGLEVCRRIKNDISLASIPVIALTAGNKEKDHIAALDAGADAFLPKDSPTEELLAVIARQIEAAAKMKLIFVKKEAKATQILVVDDCSDSRKLICGKFTEAGFDVVTDAIQFGRLGVARQTAVRRCGCRWGNARD